jgi:uncharacterized protein YdcH (DUF465 family)
MKITVINSYDEYVSYVENYKNRYYFRGQANTEWDIVPSLFRNKDLLRIEAKTIRDEVAVSKMDVIPTVFKLQHYGTPTRICDLTVSPLSALFFSTEDHNQQSKDGVVYVIDKTKSTPFQSREIDVFSKAMVSDDLKVSALTMEFLNTEEVKTILSQNYIIKYDFRFSYTNSRAILQGGTALLFGFTCEGDDILPMGHCCIDNLIVEKIIIPSSIKNKVATRLERIGFTQSILYQTFESAVTSCDFNLTQEKFDLYRRADFNKIVANYRVDNIAFNRGELAKRISHIYDKLFYEYGFNARIWLYFYFDENDLVESNFICRTEWKKDSPFIVKWTKDYYMRRMSYINEQISRNEVIDKFASLIEEVNVAYKEINDCVSERNYSLEALIKEIEKHKIQVKDSSHKVDDIAKGNFEIERYSEAAYSYIKDVERLIDEMLLYHSRGEKEQFLRYWCQALLEDCQKAKFKLDEIVASL